MSQIRDDKAELDCGQHPRFPAIFLLGEKGVSRQYIRERKNSNQALFKRLAAILGDALPDARGMKREFWRRLGPGGKSVRRLQPMPSVKMVVDEDTKQGETTKKATYCENTETKCDIGTSAP